MMRSLSALTGLVVLVLGALSCSADDGCALFNGKDFTGWQNAAGKDPGAGWVVEDGAMVRKSGAGDIWTEKRFGDFELSLEFKTEGNSGVFIRTDNRRDNVQTGIEIQVDRPAAQPNRHSVGALYDLVAPGKDPTKAGEWNKMEIKAVGSQITVLLNGEKVSEMDVDRWTAGNKNPDGTPNKFKTALKDFKREGHIGFQDHGAKVAYRNVRLKSLDKQAK